MADLIDRDDLMRKHTTCLLHNNGHNTVAELQVLLKLINEQPTVDAVPVVHAKWLHDDYGANYCSKCYEYAYEDEKYRMIWHVRYCPSCGAKMDEEEGEQDEIEKNRRT